jgi:hypothetical protein
MKYINIHIKKNNKVEYKKSEPVMVSEASHRSSNRKVNMGEHNIQVQFNLDNLKVQQVPTESDGQVPSIRGRNNQQQDLDIYLSNNKFFVQSHDLKARIEMSPASIDQV